MSKLQEKLGRMSDVLPAIHSFSGCDYTASFLRRGKVKVYEKVEKSDEYMNLFSQFGKDIELQENSKFI